MTHEATPNPLAAKLAAIMGAVSHVPKLGRNDFHKYDFAAEADVVTAIRSELSSRGVVLIPEVTSLERHEVGNKGRVLTTAYMRFTFIDSESGTEFSRTWAGWGVDLEDKGGYKAMTGAEKYFLLKTFLIPTGDDPEKDSKQPEKVTQSQPVEFDHWWDDLRMHANNGIDQMRAFFKESPVHLRAYATSHYADEMNELAKKAVAGS